MIKYKKEMIEEDVPEIIICDVCKKEYDFEEDWEEIQEFHHIHFEGGFGSVFGDGVRMKIDICQHCIKNLLGEYLTIDEDDEDECDGCSGCNELN
jgi:hypothetical protein